ncbi:MAG: hypothetical protein ACRD9R_04980 [Pyrinomonadaceae bacterium]
MSELEAEWAARVAEAAHRARLGGRGNVADYLALRAVNDLARNVGVEWLIGRFAAHADTLGRSGIPAGITIKHEDNHRFRVGLSTMVGRRLVLQLGLRSVTVEAGWPRTPSDGIVRGGGLACARISHFGDPRAREELLLVHASADGPPQWLVIDQSPPHRREPLVEARVPQHLAKLLR